MGANDVAKCLNLAEAATFSPEARVNREVMATKDMVVRMNCYEPGQVTPMHKHPDEDEVMYIAEGHGVVTFEVKDDLTIKAGDLICLPSDQFHQIIAGPDDRMVLIYFMKPDYGSVRPDAADDNPAITQLHGEMSKSG